MPAIEITAAEIEASRLAVQRALQSVPPPRPVVVRLPRKRDFLWVASEDRTPREAAIARRRFGVAWDDLAREICGRFGIAEEHLFRRLRTPRAHVARGEFRYRAYWELGLSAEEIGRRLGLNHSSVLWSVNSYAVDVLGIPNPAFEERRRRNRARAEAAWSRKQAQRRAKQ